jgi:hypothetical protein
MAMEYHSGSYIFEGFLIAFPLLGMVIFQSEIGTSLLQKNQFIWIFNILCISFYFGGLFNLIVDYTNTDLRGWWPLYLYAIFFIGLIFSLIYTLISYCFNLINRNYTYFFSSIIILILMFQKFFPVYVDIPLNINTYVLNLVFFSLIILHLVTACIIKFFKNT